MKSFNTLMTGLVDVVMLSESPTPNNYHFRFKDGVSHPEVSSATVQSHEKGHDVNFVYKGHHVRASAATKVGNDPSSGSSNGFFRSLHITKGKKFDDKKLVYSHGVGSLKVDKEKVDHDKVKAILPHIRNISEHLIRHSDRELDKHIKSQNKTLKEDSQEVSEWEHFGEAPETRMNGGRKYTYDATDRSNDPYYYAKQHRQGRMSYDGVVKSITHMGLKGDALESFKKTHLDPHKEEGKKNLTAYLAKTAKYRTVKEDSEDSEQEVPMYSKDVSGNYLKMFFQGDSSKASSVLSKLQKDGKIKSYNVIGNMLLVKFRPADSNHHEVVQDLYDAGIKDKGDVRESEIEGVKKPSSNSPAQGEDHVRKPIK